MAIAVRTNPVLSFLHKLTQSKNTRQKFESDHRLSGTNKQRYEQLLIVGKIKARLTALEAFSLDATFKVTIKNGKVVAEGDFTTASDEDKEFVKKILAVIKTDCQRFAGLNQATHMKIFFEQSSS